MQQKYESIIMEHQSASRQVKYAKYCMLLVTQPATWFPILVSPREPHVFLVILIDLITINSPLIPNNMTESKRYVSVFEVRVRSLNPWTLPSCVLPVMLGTLLAWKSSNKFDPFYLVLCSLVIIGTHAAGNFVNSYYEARTRCFYSSAIERYLTIQESARCAVVSYCIVIPTFAFLLVLSGANLWQELIIFLVGFSSSVLFGNYLKNLALGELAVSAIYGPLCVMFAYAVQVGPARQLSTQLLALYSLPLALNTECLLHSQNIRSMKSDKERGAGTLAVFLGNRAAMAVFPLLLLSPHIVTSVLGIYVSQYFFFPLICLPLAMLAIPSYEQEMLVLPQKTSIVGIVFGGLYLLSFLYNGNNLGYIRI